MDEDDEFEPGDDEAELKFDCVCGRELAVPVEMAGSMMDCPWCQKTIRVPGGVEEEAAEASPSREAEEPNEFSRCPSCAALCCEERCPSCRVVPVSAGDWEVLPFAEDQRIISPIAADWILRRARWLFSKQTRAEFFARPLILPTADYFPAKWTGDQAALEDVVARMQRYAGLADCPVKTQVKDEQTSLNAALGGMGMSVRGNLTAGCIYAPQWSDGVARIQIEMNELSDRMNLVATIGHELGHLFGYVRLGCADAPPVDNEPLTDLIAVMHGSGTFTCECAHRFKHRKLGGGWELRGWGSLGYLSQIEDAFALALFCTIREVPFSTLSPHLSLNPRSFVKDALRFFEDTPSAVREATALLK